MSAQPVSGSSSVVQLLTCFLALCSALIFILLYLRPQWAATPARRRRRSTSHHRHTSHRPTALHLAHSPSPPRTSSSSPSFSSFRLSSSSSPLSLSPLPHPSLLIPIPISSPIHPKPKRSTPSPPPRRSSSSSPFHPLHSTPHIPPPLPLIPPLLPHPVVISLTTLPSRLPHILPCLTSLHAQTYPIHRIFLHLPSPPHPPPSPHHHLTSLPWLTLTHPPLDHGPLTRLTSLPPDLHPPYYLLTVDDDLIYHPRMVEGLARASRRVGDGVALGYAGYRLRGAAWVRGNVEYARRWEEGGGGMETPAWDDEGEGEGEGEVEGLDADALRSSSPFPPSPHLSPHLSPCMSAVATEAMDVLQSWRGVLYPPSTLPSPPSALLSSLATFPPCMRSMDDEFVSGWLASQGVGRRVVVGRGGEEVVVGRLKLKEGRWSGGGVEGAVRMERRWAEGMEALVARGWWGRGWEVDGGEERGEKGEDDGGVGRGGMDGLGGDGALGAANVGELIVEEDGAGESGETLVLGTKRGTQGEGGAGARDERKEEGNEPIKRVSVMKSMHSK